MKYIKESFDNMPIAVCFFDDKGIIRLTNHRMLTVSNELCSRGIQTLSEFHEALQAPQKASLIDEKTLMYRFFDGTVLRFEETHITDGNGKKYTQITAVDVTALVEVQEELRHENKQLAEANAAARRLYENMAEIVRDEEILSMKMRVHDDIGHSIIAAKKALMNDEDIEAVRKNASIWENSIELLHHANSMNEQSDDLEYAIKRAEALGVKIIIDGEFPTREKLRHLFSLALRECTNNCVKHANGNEIYAEISHRDNRCFLTVTNNGNPPAKEITEGGGLSGLRSRFERNSGTMTVKSFPKFELVVSLEEI